MFQGGSSGPAWKRERGEEDSNEEEDRSEISNEFSILVNEAQVTRRATITAPKDATKMCGIIEMHGRDQVGRSSNFCVVDDRVFFPLDLFGVYVEAALRSNENALTQAKQDVQHQIDKCHVTLNKVQENGTLRPTELRFADLIVGNEPLHIELKPFKFWSSNNKVVVGYVVCAASPKLVSIMGGKAPYKSAFTRSASLSDRSGLLLTCSREKKAVVLQHTELRPCRDDKMMMHAANTALGDCGSPLMVGDVVVGIHVLGERHLDHTIKHNTNFVIVFRETEAEIQARRALQSAELTRVTACLGAAGDDDAKETVNEAAEENFVSVADLLGVAEPAAEALGVDFEPSGFPRGGF
jgi:hypothetical protein